MITVSEFQALPDAEQRDLLVSLIGNRQVLANVEIVGNVKAVKLDSEGYICANNFINRRRGPVTIKTNKKK